MNDNIKSVAATDKTESGKYRRWNNEIAKANKSFEKWHKQGHKVIKRYLDERDAANANERRFNIFTANVDIISASLYSKLPKVDVSRRFDQAMDDPARFAALMLENCVKQDMEESESYFDQVMRNSVQDALLPGLGVAWLRLETETATKTLAEQIDPITGQIMQEEAEYEEVSHQDVPIDYVHWDDFIWSPCRTWEERRWVARKVYLDYDALVARFGEKKAALLPVKLHEDKIYSQLTDSTKDEAIEKALIYEVWDRQKRRVLWLSLDLDQILDEKDDPLQLDDFEPFPRPMFANMTTSACVPVPDFVIIQDQYNEMDQVNNRVSLLVQACKVVGCYDASATGVQRMLQEGYDNMLIPVDSWAMFAERGGIKGAVDWLPLDVVIQALEKLRQSREDIKGQIYELTGISDIVRGNTKASETLGAQQLKAQFASVRIQTKQNNVARFAQDILRIKAEIICKHFTPDQIILMSGAQYYPDFQNQQLVAAAIQLLKGDYEKFEWRINVQADSMAMDNHAIVKKDRVEFLNALATFLQSAATTLKAVPDAAPILFESLKFAVAGFKGAQELEGVIDATLVTIMQKINAPPAPPPPDPAVVKAQIDMQVAQQKAQLDAQAKQQDMQITAQKAQLEMASKAQGLQFNTHEQAQAMANNQQEHAQAMAHQADAQSQELAIANAKFMQQIAIDSAKSENKIVQNAREDAAKNE